MASDQAPVSALTELKVTVEKPELILPAEPTPRETLYLSNIEQQVVFPVETVYFFPPNPDKSNETVVEVLREALRKVLVPYHFKAGRLRFNQTEKRLEIDCNRAGSEFTAATTDLTIAELGDLTYPNPLFRNLIPQSPDASNILEKPLLMTQVTKFKCGGFSVGFVMNHLLHDGKAAMEFLLNLSSIARGKELVVVPKPDRTLLKARSPPSISHDHTLEYGPLGDGVNGSLQTNDLEDLARTTEFKVFSFTAETLLMLKNKALEDGTLRKCTTFEAVAAHVWQSRVKSMDWDPDRDCRMGLVADIRQKVEPPLPEAFCGVAVTRTVATARARDLCEKPLSFAVSKIHEALERLTDDFVRSQIDYWEVNRCNYNTPDSFTISSWWRIPFYKIDFGWGKPSYAGPIVNPHTQFVLFTGNGMEDGSMNVFTALQKKNMGKFEEQIRVQT